MLVRTNLDRTDGELTESVDSTPVVTDANLNEVEKEAQVKQELEAEENGASTDRLKQTTSLLCKMLNLDESYRVNGFSDKGKVIKETFENDDLIIQVTIKNSENHCID